MHITNLYVWIYFPIHPLIVIAYLCILVHQTKQYNIIVSTIPLSYDQLICPNLHKDILSHKLKRTFKETKYQINKEIHAVYRPFNSHMPKHRLDIESKSVDRA